MKKLLIVMTVAIGMLAGCKKGPNDPGISWRGRDARMIGEWILESFLEVETDKTGNNTIETTTKLEGGKITSVTKMNGSGTPVTGTNSYKGTLTLDKEGKATFVQVSTPASGSATTMTHVGSWKWLNGKKNKSCLLLSDINTTLLDGGTYDIDELRNKKLVLTHKSSTKTESTSSSSSETDFKMTFTQ